jgi:hypothetical protein
VICENFETYSNNASSINGWSFSYQDGASGGSSSVQSSGHVLNGNALRLWSFTGTHMAYARATDSRVLNLTNSVIEARVAYSNESDTLMFLRMTDTGSGYWATTRCNNGYGLMIYAYGGISFFKMTNGIQSNLGYTGYSFPGGLVIGQPMNVAFRAEGTSFKGYINDSLIMSATDSTYASGGVGIASQGFGWWDEMKINPAACDWTRTITLTPTPTPTFTPSRTESPTRTASASNTFSPTVSPTPTPTIDGCTAACAALVCENLEGCSNGATSVNGWNFTYVGGAGSSSVQNSGTGYVLNGEALKLVANAGSYHTAMARPTDSSVQNLGTTVLQARVPYVLGVSAGAPVMMVRMTPNGSGDWNAGNWCYDCYLLTLEGTNVATILEINLGTQYSMSNTRYNFPQGLTAGQPINLEFRATGSSLQGYINGTLVTQVTHSGNPSGGVSIGTMGTGWWDDLKVNPVTCGWTATPTVTPTFTPVPTDTVCPQDCGAHADGPKDLASEIHMPQGKDLLAAPNPAFTQATVFFRLHQRAEKTRLTLVDLNGNKVQSRILGAMLAGEHKEELSYQGLPPGIYLLALESDEGMGYNVRAVFKVAVVPAR